MEDKVDEPTNKKAKMDDTPKEDSVALNNEAPQAEKQAPQTTEDGKPLSKRALKRLAKRENFHQWKMEKRVKEREKKKQKKRARIERGEPRNKPSKKEMKRNRMENSNCKVRVVIDSSFDDFMSEREINSHVLQMQHAYASNRRASNPLQFYVTSVSGGTESRLVSVGDYKGWDVNFHHEHYLDLFKKEDVVYLSSDSPNVLHTLDEEKVYIIGGLVDHNKHKGLCHKKAEEAGISHVRLPIGEYIKLQTRKVLACNHVFEILLRYTELHDWEKAFFSVIPKRKGATEKDDEGNASQNEEERDDQNDGEQNREGDEESNSESEGSTEENQASKDFETINQDRDKSEQSA